MFSALPPKFKMLVLMAISFVATWLVFWPIFRIAKMKNLVDNPDARKLQKVPVPVMGGVAVFFGIVMGLCFFKTMLSYTALFATMGAMMIMLYVGTIDDVLSLSPWVRLVAEILVAVLVIFGTHFSVCNFQGLWGIDRLPQGVSIPLTILAMVGIINSINMIDGVDGLCSGYCIFACSMMGMMCFLSFDYSFAALAAVSIGALLPFFLHNVFGWETKMFIGDGGTMVMGTILSSLVVCLCRGRSSDALFPGLDSDPNVSFVAFALAVMSVPVFDTIRVMSVRILHGQSPFHADRNHLHHLFIETGYSHIFTTISEIFLGAFVVACWFLSLILGASVELQFYVVIAVSALTVFGLATMLRSRLDKGGEAAERAKARALRSHVERRGFWLRIQRLVDGPEDRSKGKVVQEK